MGLQAIIKGASDLLLYYDHHSIQISQVGFETVTALLKRDALISDQKQEI